MHKATICLLMLLCSIAVSAQKQPQWKVVQAIAVTNQTAPIQETTLFTPIYGGVYRLSVYMSGGAGKPGASWDLSVAWYDLTGASSDFGELQVSTGGANWTQHAPSMLSIMPGTPLLYSVQPDGNTSGSYYNLAITLEKLEQ
jgi:hypothetical protein